MRKLILLLNLALVGHLFSAAQHVDSTSIQSLIKCIKAGDHPDIQAINQQEFQQYTGESNNTPTYVDDGQDIVFILSGEIYVQDNNGQRRKKLIPVSPRYLEYGMPKWSQIGNKIAYVGLVSTTQIEIRVASSDGTNNKTVLMGDVRGTNFSSIAVNDISWSYDDRYLSVSSIAIDVTGNSVAITQILDLANNNQIVRNLSFYTAAEFTHQGNSYKLAFTGIQVSSARSVVGVNDIFESNGQVIWCRANSFSIWDSPVWVNFSTIFARVNFRYLFDFQASNSCGFQNLDVGANRKVTKPSFSRSRNNIYYSIISQNGSGRLVKANLLTGNPVIFNPVDRGSGHSPNWRTNIVVSVKEQTSVTDLVLFPNPVENLLQISFRLETPSTTALEIISMTGQKFWHTTLGKGQKFGTSVDVSRFPTGMYLLRISTKTGTVSYRFQKTHD